MLKINKLLLVFCMICSFAEVVKAEETDNTVKNLKLVQTIGNVVGTVGGATSTITSSIASVNVDNLKDKLNTCKESFVPVPSTGNDAADLQTLTMQYQMAMSACSDMDKIAKTLKALTTTSAIASGIGTAGSAASLIGKGLENRHLDTDSSKEDEESEGVDEDKEDESGDAQPINTTIISVDDGVSVSMLNQVGSGSLGTGIRADAALNHQVGADMSERAMTSSLNGEEVEERKRLEGSLSFDLKGAANTANDVKRITNSIVKKLNDNPDKTIDERNSFRRGGDMIPKIQSAINEYNNLARDFRNRNESTDLEGLISEANSLNTSLDDLKEELDDILASVETQIL